jgi:putative transposase
MRRIDELHLDHPFAGSRMLKRMLRDEGFEVGRTHVRTLMRQMGVEAFYRRPRTSQPHPGHRVFPYLLRDQTIDRPNQVWALDITYLPMKRGFAYLVTVLDWATRRVLAWQLPNTLAPGLLRAVLARQTTLNPQPNHLRIAVCCSGKPDYLSVNHGPTGARTPSVPLVPGLPGHISLLCSSLHQLDCVPG